MTYKEYVITETKKLIEEAGGVRKASKMYGIDSAILSKMANGTYIPRPKTLEKWLPGKVVIEEDPKQINVTNFEVSVECEQLDELKKQLQVLGYEIQIVRSKR